MPTQANRSGGNNQVPNTESAKSPLHKNPLRVLDLRDQRQTGGNGKAP